MTETALTPRQTGILRFICEFHRERGFSPSIREITQGVRLRSKASTHYQLDRLEDLGYIRRERWLPRTIVILREAP